MFAFEAYLVQVPKQKKFSSACGRASNVTKQVSIGVPKYTVKAQYNLNKYNIIMVT